MVRVGLGVAALSDEAVLVGLGLGDPYLGAEFVRRFERRVIGLAVTMVGDRALAEDIAQEALLRAWRHAAIFDPGRASVITWLLSITRNLAIDSLRRRRATPTAPNAPVFTRLAAPDRSPDDRAVDTDTAARLRRAVSAVPPDQCRALTLAVYYGYTAQQIAEIESIPLGTAKTRIRAAIAKVRTAMTTTLETQL
ncbi:MAG: sigma-70 family RNA polymerase sigma factor [Jatrophihabitantaceae bacterium]